MSLTAALLAGPVRAGDETICTAAGTDAERRLQVPSGLLLAIGRVESGRRDPASGRILPWPWTINAGGVSQSFSDSASALAVTRALLAKGVASIDVGCFQINLAAHPAAFSTLDDAFDPAANANYAARFLTTLRDRLGSWEGAVAAYHSATPELGIPYRNLVLDVWDRTVPVGAGDVPAPALRVLAWSPTQGVQVWTPNGGAGANVISFPGSDLRPVINMPRG